MKQVKVSDPVHEELQRIRDEGEHTSFDSAIRQLIRDSDYYTDGEHQSL